MTGYLFLHFKSLLITVFYRDAKENVFMLHIREYLLFYLNKKKCFKTFRSRVFPFRLVLLSTTVIKFKGLTYC